MVFTIYALTMYFFLSLVSLSLSCLPFSHQSRSMTLTTITNMEIQLYLYFNLYDIIFKFKNQRFAEVFLGDFDTPEVIWKHSMRRYLVEQVMSLQHGKKRKIDLIIIELY